MQPVSEVVQRLPEEEIFSKLNELIDLNHKLEARVLGLEQREITRGEY